MVSQRRRMASQQQRPEARLAAAARLLLLRSSAVRGSMVTPISGVNSTATTQEISSATAITANSVKVYSPAELPFKPIGMKPATVTRVPVSIGKAVEV